MGYYYSLDKTYYQIIMRFAQQRQSPLKRYVNDPRKTIASKNWNSRINSQNTYMHYNNAIYMGDLTSYKRNGQGIMLFDQGTSAICEYSFDNMIGHNLFIAQNSIASVLILKKGCYEIVLRTSHFIFKLPFYQNQYQPNGNGILVNFKRNQIYHLIYQCGKLVKKIAQTNKDILINVQKQNLKSIMDIRHEQAFKFQIKFKNGIKIQKKNSKINIGYFDNHHNQDGLCMKLSVKENTYDSFNQPLQLKCVERGYYHRGRLQNYGQRYFANGNLYIGQFQNDFFQGKGLLLYPSYQKWVYGEFQKQKLKKMIQTSLVQQPSLYSSKANTRHLLKQIHQLNTNNWINTKIEGFSWSQILNRFKEGLESETTDVVVEKQRVKREQEQRLQIIKKHFSNQIPGREINRVIKTQKAKNSISPEKIIINEFRRKTAKVIEIQPSTVENELYWSKQTSLRVLPNYQHSQKRYNNMNIREQIRYQGSLQKLRPSPFKGKVIPSKLINKTNKKTMNIDLYNSVQY